MSALAWHRPGPGNGWALFTHYRDAGRLRVVFLYRSGERALIRTLDHSLKLLREEKRESLKQAKRLVELRARRGEQRP